MFRIACLLLGLAGFAATDARAASLVLPDPKGPVLLTIDGNITVTNDGARAVFDYDMLAALPQKHIQTSTPWTQGRPTFAGPALLDVMSLVGAQSSQITAYALNDFNAVFPLDDWRSEKAIIAITYNGAPIPRRGNGPLWIVMPFDDHLDYKSEIVLSRSVWSLHRITVSP